MFKRRGTPESRRIVAMLAREYRTRKKDYKKTLLEKDASDLEMLYVSQLEFLSQLSYIKAKQLLNEE